MSFGYLSKHIDTYAKQCDADPYCNVVLSIVQLIASIAYPKVQLSSMSLMVIRGGRQSRVSDVCDGMREKTQHRTRGMYCV